MTEAPKPGWGAVLLVPAIVAALALTFGFWAQVAEERRIDADHNARIAGINQRLNSLIDRVITLDDRQRQIAVNTERLERIEAELVRLDDKGSRATLVLEERLRQLEQRTKHR